MKRSALLIGDEPRVVVTVARSLHRIGIEVSVAQSPYAPLVRSRAIRRSLRLPEAATADAVSARLDVVRAAGCDVVFPCSDSALAFAAEAEAPLRGLATLAAPGAEAIRIVLDKDRTVAAAQAAGLPVPQLYTVPSRDALHASRDIQYPVVAKPRSKRGKQRFKVRYYASVSELDAEFAADPAFGQDYLIQEYVAGDGVGVGVLMHDGEPLATVQHRRLKEYPSTGGVSVTAVSEEVDRALADDAVRLLAGIGWHGVAMVEFKQDRASNRAALMEVNGRFWGSIALAVHAGTDLPQLAWESALGRPRSAPAGRPGVRMHWVTGELLRLHQLARDPDVPERGKQLRAAARQFVVDVLRPSAKALWSTRDPAPAVSELYRAVRHIAAAEVRSVGARVLPGAWLARVREYRRLEPDIARTLATLRVRRAVGRGPHPSAALLRSARRIVFVCRGNILRSPVAAAIFARRARELGLRDLDIRSAGLRAKPGRAADPRGVEAAEELGVSLREHRAEPVTRELLAGTDLVVTMDLMNEAHLAARFPEARAKVIPLGAFRPAKRRSAEIPDPYEGDLGDVRQCYRDIDDCVRALVAMLRG